MSVRLTLPTEVRETSRTSLVTVGSMPSNTEDQTDAYVGNKRRGSYDNSISFDDDDSADVKWEGDGDDHDDDHDTEGSHESLNVVFKVL